MRSRVHFGSLAVIKTKLYEGPLSRPRTITHRRDPSEAGKLSFNKLAELVVGIS